jgi:hypothetical protein
MEEKDLYKQKYLLLQKVQENYICWGCGDCRVQYTGETIDNNKWYEFSKPEGIMFLHICHNCKLEYHLDQIYPRSFNVIADNQDIDFEELLKRRKSGDR